MHLGEILQVHDMARTSVLLDPPATGLTARVIDSLIGARPVEIVYISCNPRLSLAISRALPQLSPDRRNAARHVPADR
jgi:tRNA/tmRNA/rRNA uracil-C5-methylase (TrmA/RlmC/RlmD family)